MGMIAPPRMPRAGAGVSDTIDASLYDNFASKYAALELAQMLKELRGWTTETCATQSVAAMARLLDLSIMSQTLSATERRTAARLAVVLEEIVRSKLKEKVAAISTIEGAYRLLLRFGESHSPCPDVIAWTQMERRRRGLPAIGG